MPAWLQNIWRSLWWEWGEADDPSPATWLFPVRAAWVVVLASALLTAVLGIATNAAPVFWLPLALAAMALVFIGLAIVQELHLRGRRSADKQLGLITKPDKAWFALSAAPFEIHYASDLAVEGGGSPIQRIEACLADERKEPPDWPGATRNLSLPKYRNPQGLDLVNCEIVRETRAFYWTWGHPQRRLETGFSLHPWELDGKAERALTIAGATAWADLKPKAELVWAMLRAPMTTLIANGHLRIWARQDSATAPFDIIPPDAWTRFEITDWEQGTAVSGLKALHAIHLEVAGKDPSSSLEFAGLGKQG